MICLYNILMQKPSAFWTAFALPLRLLKLSSMVRIFA